MNMSGKDRSTTLNGSLLTKCLGVMVCTMILAQNAHGLELSGMDHVGLNVKNLDASVRWYADVLGFTTLHTWPGVTMVGKGNIRIGLFSAPAATVVENQQSKITITHFAFAVDGDKFLDALQTIAAKGVKIEEGPEDTGIAYSFFFRDPDNHQIEITSYHGKGSLMPALAPPPPQEKNHTDEMSK